jgi:glycosyltransferase involved in cell wall biosynthesis
MRIGGEELSTLSLIKEMVARRHNVYVMGSSGPMHDEFVAAGAEVILTSNPYRRSIFGILSDAKDIKNFVKANSIDIIHSQSVLPTISAFCALRLLAIKPKLIFHERGIKKYTYRIIPQLLNAGVDCVITNSDHEVAQLMRGGLHIPCHRIHNCINTAFNFDASSDLRTELGIDVNTRIIGIVGRLAKEKGHYYLLDAFKKVFEGSPKQRLLLLIVGDGPLRENITRKIQELSLEGHVMLIGFRRDLERIYPAMDMLVVPSVLEPFGNVAIEAGAFGLPVIASSVGGLPEALMHGESGLLVPPGNPGKLAEAMRQLLADPDLSRRLGNRGKELAKTYFTPQRVANEIEAIYTDNCSTVKSC